MITKLLSTENSRQDLSLLEKILPWTCTGPIVKIVDNAKCNKPYDNNLKNKNEYTPTNPKETIVEKETKIKSDKTDQPKSYATAKIAKTFEDTIPDNQNTPLLEMWNVIESVGIRRDNLDRIFRTDEAAVSELYSLVEKRLHYQREQDMIKRLKAHVEKLVKAKTDSKPTV